MVNAFINQGRETIFMVMELVEGFTLRNYVKDYWKKRIRRKLLESFDSGSDIQSFTSS